MNWRARDVSTRHTGIQKVGRPREVAHEAKRCTGACCEHELQREKNPPGCTVDSNRRRKAVIWPNSIRKGRWYDILADHGLTQPNLRPSCAQLSHFPGCWFGFTRPGK